MKNHYLIMTIMFAFLGCTSTPQYNTSHSYTEPSSKEGKSRISQCVKAKSKCEQLEYQSCNQRNSNASIVYSACMRELIMMMELSDKAKKNIGWYSKECKYSPEKCTLDNTICLTSYNKCYSTSGGIVKSKTVCIENCKN